MSTLILGIVWYAMAIGGWEIPADRSTVDPDAERLNQILTALVLDHMPHQYTDDKKWGHQTRRWDGLKWERDGLRLETRRRWKMVNHGTWRKYTAELLDPKNQFSIRLSNLHNTDDGATAFDLEIASDLKLSARQSKWVKGVQLYSIHAQGQARIRLQLACETRIELEFGHFPPDLRFAPRVVDARLVVDEFRIDRVGKVGGEVAQQVTRAARKKLDEKIEEKQQKLVDKINSQLDKKKDQLTLSLSDASASKWIQQARPFLPPVIRSALREGGRQQPAGSSK